MGGILIILAMVISDLLWVAMGFEIFLADPLFDSLVRRIGFVDDLLKLLVTGKSRGLSSL